MVDTTPADIDKPKHGYLKCKCGRYAAVGVFYDKLNFRCWDCADGDRFNYVSKHIRPNKNQR